MNNNRIVFVLIAFIVSAFAQQASASPAAVMRVIGKANPPIGHYEFCQTYQSECQPTSVDTGPMKLTEERWKTMLDVNYTAIPARFCSTTPTGRIFSLSISRLMSASSR